MKIKILHWGPTISKPFFSLGEQNISNFVSAHLSRASEQLNSCIPEIAWHTRSPMMPWLLVGKWQHSPKSVVNNQFSIPSLPHNVFDRPPMGIKPICPYLPCALPQSNSKFLVDSVCLFCGKFPIYTKKWTGLLQERQFRVQFSSLKWNMGDIDMEDIGSSLCQFCMIWKTLDMISWELSILIKQIKDENDNDNIRL